MGTLLGVHPIVRWHIQPTGPSATPLRGFLSFLFTFSIPDVICPRIHRISHSETHKINKKNINNWCTPHIPLRSENAFRHNPYKRIVIYIQNSIVVHASTFFFSITSKRPPWKNYEDNIGALHFGVVWVPGIPTFWLGTRWASTYRGYYRYITPVKPRYFRPCIGATHFTPFTTFGSGPTL